MKQKRAWRISRINNVYKFIRAISEALNRHRKARSAYQKSPFHASVKALPERERGSSAPQERLFGNAA